MVQGLNPSGGEIFCTCPDQPWGPPSLLYNGYWDFPRGKERSGCDADLSPPSSAVGHERVELYLYSPVWAVWPVQSLSACTRVHFTFTLFQDYFTAWVSSPTLHLICEIKLCFMKSLMTSLYWYWKFVDPLNAELYSICHLLALLGAHPILHFSRIRVKLPILCTGFSYNAQ